MSAKPHRADCLFSSRVWVPALCLRGGLELRRPAASNANRTYFMGLCPVGLVNVFVKDAAHQVEFNDRLIWTDEKDAGTFPKGKPK